jgi:hypothetical protein
MKLLRLVGAIAASGAIVGCAGSSAVRGSAQFAPCLIADASQLLMHSDARGIRLDLPADAEGPSYDSDDWYASRPTWTGAHWHVHFVYGNGGLTEFMKGDRCCSLDDSEMHRNVCVGEYMYYGAMADISRVASPDKVSSAQVTIEPNGITENEALKIIASMVTTWEQQ